MKAVFFSAFFTFLFVPLRAESPALVQKLGLTAQAPVEFPRAKMIQLFANARAEEGISGSIDLLDKAVTKVTATAYTGQNNEAISVIRLEFQKELNAKELETLLAAEKQTFQRQMLILEAKVKRPVTTATSDSQEYELTHENAVLKGMAVRQWSPKGIILIQCLGVSATPKELLTLVQAPSPTPQP